MSESRKSLPDLPFAPSFCGLGEQIAIHGRFRPHEPALIEGDRTVDWGSYDRTGNRIGHALIASGIQPGDRIALLAGNHLWAHEVLLGIWRAGAAAVPLSPLLDDGALQRMLEDSGAAMLLVGTDYLERADGIAPPGTQVIREGGEFTQWGQDGAETPTGRVNAADDLALIIYSSGTTGVPKGIAHSHGSRLSFASGFAAEFRFHCHSVALSCVPMHSNGAWLSWSPAKWMGAATVILPAFSADAFIDAIRRHRPTHGFIVPAMAAVLLAQPGIENAGLDCFETAITAGSPMPRGVKEAVQKLTGGALYELWGLTEGVATIITPQDMEQRPESVGRPMLGCDIRIVDEHGQDITFSGTGEIVGHSAGQMSGYWNRPDANAELVWRDPTGWIFLRTGDLGEFDRSGYLTLRGRMKDMIISGGLNVYPVDIETVLLEHQDVHDAAVVAAPHEKWGEVPVAFIKPEPDADTDPQLADAILEWANARLARHQRLHRVLIHPDDFPRNTMGKVIKARLQEAL
ncbi:class I adenylate-forming enzyme family protein [Elongatibacter sediminis]|uniref:Class I adenylate-forming enzyme family protein n=1 Tax=Elongatibacter sediminis TaxID=3119006 RepID=A0AAW9RGQ3_9GAMM